MVQMRCPMLTLARAFSNKLGQKGSTVRTLTLSYMKFIWSFLGRGQSVLGTATCRLLGCVNTDQMIFGDFRSTGTSSPIIFLLCMFVCAALYVYVCMCRHCTYMCMQGQGGQRVTRGVFFNGVSRVCVCMPVSVVLACMCVNHMCTWCHGVQKRPLELEL